MRNILTLTNAVPAAAALLWAVLAPCAGDRAAAAGDGLAQPVIEVKLPADAEVFIDDDKTASTGESRRFLPPPLPTGRPAFR